MLFCCRPLLTVSPGGVTVMFPHKLQIEKLGHHHRQMDVSCIFEQWKDTERSPKTSRPFDQQDYWFMNFNDIFKVWCPLRVFSSLWLCGETKVCSPRPPRPPGFFYSSVVKAVTRLLQVITWDQVVEVEQSIFLPLITNYIFTLPESKAQSGVVARVALHL